jgi:hypothetical protein
MAQQIFSRTVCDWCTYAKGKETVFERSIADDMSAGGPEYQRILRIDDLTKTVDMCPDCEREVLAPLRVFLDRFGVDVVGRRMGRPPGKASPAPTAPSAPPPVAVPVVPPVVAPVVVAPVPEGLFMAPLSPPPTPPTNGRAHVPAEAITRTAPSRTPIEKSGTGDMYPCPLCDGVAYANNHGLSDHAKRAHGIGFDVIIGSDCHYCGKALGNYHRLGSHFGISHRADAYSGRTLSESMILARANGDPHGTVAVRMEILTGIQRERTQNNGANAGTTHTTVS